MTAPAGVRRRVAAACACALVVLGASACSGGGDGDGGDGDSERNAAASTTEGVESTTTTAEGESGSAGGGTGERVPGVAGEVAGPVALDAAADVGDGVEVRLSRIEAVEAEATLPGEVGGPAVAVTVEVTNGSQDAIDLGHVTVDLVTGEGASAPPVLDPDHEPLTGELDAGDDRAGTYVFTLADEERADVSVRVRYSADSPTAVFTGSVRNA